MSKDYRTCSDQVIFVQLYGRQHLIEFNSDQKLEDCGHDHSLDKLGLNGKQSFGRDNGQNLLKAGLNWTQLNIFIQSWNIYVNNKTNKEWMVATIHLLKYI